MKDGKLDGPFEEYHENGQLRKKCTYKYVKCDGPYELYWHNGQLAEKCTYKNGEYDGLYARYWFDGLLKEKYTYKNGKIFDKEARQGLNTRLAQIERMPPSHLRQDLKRAEVAKFRAKFPNKKDGR